MTGYDKSLVEINGEEIRILCREIGLVNTISFLNQHTDVLGYYTEERKKLFGGMPLDQIISEIKQARQENG